MTSRRWDLDALRGLMLVLMAFTHLPTRFSGPTGQPFGFVSAAEGFVLLSAYMAGMVYTGRAMKDGEPVMQEAFFKRALKIYLCQAALLLFLFTVIAAVGVLDRQEAVTNLLTFYLEHPWTAFVSGLLLIYSPPLLDILPMYILLMLASPLLLLHGMNRGWRGILVVSVLLWVISQFDIAMTAYNAIGAWAHVKLIPYNELGSFELFAWQFIWVLGLWMGSTSAASPKAPPLQFPRWMVRSAIVMALIGFVWRHAIGQSPFYDNLTLNLLWDKWHVGPLRLLDFLSLLLLTMHYGPWLKAHLPRVKWLETMGSASLPVFCAHLVLALSALALFGDAKPGRNPAIDIGIIVVSFAVMYFVAWLSQQADERAAALKKQRAARRAGKASAASSPRPLPSEAPVVVSASPSGLKSQPSTTRSPHG